MSIIEIQHEKPIGATDVDASVLTEPARHEAQLPEPDTQDQTQNQNDESNAPPDGGLQAWLQVVASFLLYFNHLGLLNSFGVFQTYYETDLLSTSSPSSISWIGSIQIFCLMSVGALIGPLYDAGYCRALLAAGTLLVTLGFMLASVSTRYWQMLLAQGVCLGLGACCLSIPSIAIVPMYFKRRRARAMGLATVGSGLGATLYPLMFEKLRPAIGFGWTMRAMGFMAFAMCSFALLLIRPRSSTAAALSSSKKQKPGWQAGGFSIRWFWDPSALRERTYLLYCVAIFFNNLSFFNPPYYLQSYAVLHGMRGHALAAYLLPILNASSIPGRIIPGFVADRVGSLDTYVVVCALSSASVFYWISVTNAAGNIAFAVLYGFWSGSVVALGSVVLTSITPDMSRLGTRLGMVSILKGIGSLIGPPISGAILNGTGKYIGIQLLAACGIMLTSLLSLVLRLVIARALFKSVRDDDEAYMDATRPKSKAPMEARVMEDKRAT
ncbi:MFS general substrate transporter [Trichoderma citrinoviride]|uniref:MFS general substrate transporter n=1 Tax=Trichoderma citrinoviride TaxID=58853 RepID=A0A2T4B323_9HYPO|nr:MFS general substrate transporter [Trichoderma citrinoviride]PTB63725.1 MFS general substrate transporter [Trichoderma citrinoviride]